MLTGAYYALSPISFIIGNPCNILFVLFSLKLMFSLLTICQVTTYSLSWITFRLTHHPLLPLSANYTAQYPHPFSQACLNYYFLFLDIVHCALLLCKFYTVFQTIGAGDMSFCLVVEEQVAVFCWAQCLVLLSWPNAEVCHSVDGQSQMSAQPLFKVDNLIWFSLVPVHWLAAIICSCMHACKYIL